MRNGAIAFTLCAAAFAAGCGPAIRETRMGYYPPKADNCHVDIVNGAMKNPMIMASPSSEYEPVGMISLGEYGAQDPFSTRYLKIVLPRACEMGGDAISLAISSVTHSGPDTGTGTGYVVLRKRRQPSPATATGAVPAQGI